MFGPLKKLKPIDYDFILEIVTLGVFIKCNEVPPPISHANYPINNEFLI